jgi:hypothetical protein
MQKARTENPGFSLVAGVDEISNFDLVKSISETVDILNFL